MEPSTTRLLFCERCRTATRHHFIERRVASTVANTVEDVYQCRCHTKRRYGLYDRGAVEITQLVSHWE